jgi:hypothetical protein
MEVENISSVIIVPISNSIEGIPYSKIRIKHRIKLDECAKFIGLLHRAIQSEEDPN